MTKKGRNDLAWEKLFEKYNILRRIERNGFFQISATQIKEFREPRLMVKFDHTSDLPKLFTDNKLAILPVTRGDYVISHFDAYHKFETASKPIVRMSLPPHIQSLDYYHISSEAIALNCAIASGMIADFLEDEELLATVSGRMSSGIFDFEIRDTQYNSREVHVENSQIEIDAAYEGVRYLSIFEAKRELSEDFLIRQLYYPFRLWHSRVSKIVKPVFLVYSNSIYRFYEYDFQKENYYNSLRLVKQVNYSLEDTAITSADIQSILDSVIYVDEPAIPFPQANKFERVINICELVNTQELNRADVTKQYAFDARQTNYYTDAARYLGLVEKRIEYGTPIYKITNLGKRILNLNFKQRQLAFANCILQHKVFHKTLCWYFRNGCMPTDDKIVEIMRRSNLFSMGMDSTYYRRASTVKGWINWIAGLING